MRKHPQIALDTMHHFSKGLYARELHIPAGVILTGHVHKAPQLNLLMEGEIEVSVDGRIELLVAPQIVCSPAGTKRIARALTDVVWVTVLATEETDIDKIEETFLARNEDEYRDWLAGQPPAIAGS